VGGQKPRWLPGPPVVGAPEDPDLKANASWLHSLVAAIVRAFPPGSPSWLNLVSSHLPLPRLWPILSLLIRCQDRSLSPSYEHRLSCSRVRLRWCSSSCAISAAADPEPPRPAPPPASPRPFAPAVRRDRSGAGPRARASCGPVRRPPPVLCWTRAPPPDQPSNAYVIHRGPYPGRGVCSLPTGRRPFGQPCAFSTSGFLLHLRSPVVRLSPSSAAAGSPGRMVRRVALGAPASGATSGSRRAPARHRPPYSRGPLVDRKERYPCRCGPPRCRGALSIRGCPATAAAGVAFHILTRQAPPLRPPMAWVWEPGAAVAGLSWTSSTQLRRSWRCPCPPPQPLAGPGPSAGRFEAMFPQPGLGSAPQGVLLAMVP